ncbi:MAG: heme o synthase [Arsenophonus sp.]|nr:MAG: heme o synthase [Arsenophonus sp.]
MHSLISSYIEIIKPRIVFGNLISLIAGFFVALKGEISYSLLVNVLLGVFFITASASIFNNYFDRNIDSLMKRTKNRVLVTKEINTNFALIYGILLFLIGFIWLLLKTNKLVLFFTLFGFIFYALIYTYTKRVTSYSILIGSLSGAVLPLIGYCALSSALNLEIIILFFIFILWQMPHSYCIILLHLNDYRSAKIPVLPLIKSIYITKIHIFIYIFFFIILKFFYFFKYIKHHFFFIHNFLDILWFFLSIIGFKDNLNEKIWSRSIFIFSIIIIMLTNIIIIYNKLVILYFNN